MTAPRRRVGVAAAAVLIAACGCATSYQPRPSRRASVVMRDGNLAFEREGRPYDHGVFGGGLVDAVAGVPAAEEHAETYNGRMIAGGVLGISGAALTGGGVGVLIGNETSDQPMDGLRGLSIGLLVGGLVTSIIGSIFVASAQPHMWDALNLYNDAVTPDGLVPPPAMPAYYGPPGAPPTPPVTPASPAPLPPPPPSVAPPPVAPPPPASGPPPASPSAPPASAPAPVAPPPASGPPSAPPPG